jgi:hypothetical protein
LRLLLAVLLLAAGPALAISPEAQEFLEISKKLEPMQCEKRKLRRGIAIADVERDAEKSQALRARYEELNRDKSAAKLEKRLSQLEPRIVDKDGKARRPEDLDAVNLQRREAFYRCG